METSALDKEIAPYIHMSRKAFPKARARFLKGLPADQQMFITIRLYDHDRQDFEQVFVHVETIKDQSITGRIASALHSIRNHKQGDRITVQEKELIDWTISSSNGSEEGNYVGKFLDVLQDGVVPLIVKIDISKQGRVSSAQFALASNRYRKDVS